MESIGVDRSFTKKESNEATSHQMKFVEGKYKNKVGLKN